MWDLKMWPAYEYVYQGPDQSKRVDLWHKMIAKHTNSKCLQVGVYAGNKIAPNFTSIDLYDTCAAIDYREDLAKTTLPNDTFDFIVCNAILEHVRDPFECVKQMHRIAKSKADIWIEVPFVQPYHPRKDYQISDGYLCENRGGQGDVDHGGDYWRFTPEGTKLLMEPFIMDCILLIDQGGICFIGHK